MRRYTQIFGNIKMTTSILALVMTAIIGSIAAVSGAIYFNLHEQALAASQQQQNANLGGAATILERGLSGSVLNWTPDGTIQSFQSWSVPPFHGTEVIDSVTRVTKQDASIYVLDAETQVFLAKTTSLVGSSGERLSEVVLDAASPAYAPLLERQPYVGEISIDGRRLLWRISPD